MILYWAATLCERYRRIPRFLVGWMVFTDSASIHAQEAMELLCVSGAFLFAGYGLFRLYRNPRRRTLGIVLTVLAIVVLVPLVYVELTFHE